MVRERAVKNGVTSRSSPTLPSRWWKETSAASAKWCSTCSHNAVEFTPQGGTVQASSAQENGEVLGLGRRHRSRDRARRPRADLRRVPADRGGPGTARGHRSRAPPLRGSSSSCTAEDLAGVPARPGPDFDVHAAGRSAVVNLRLVQALTSLTAKYVAVFVLLVAVPAHRNQLPPARLVLQRQQGRADPRAAGAGESVRRPDRPDTFRNCRRRAPIDGQGLSPADTHSNPPAAPPQLVPADRGLLLDSKGATAVSVGRRNVHAPWRRPDSRRPSRRLRRAREDFRRIPARPRPRSRSQRPRATAPASWERSSTATPFNVLQRLLGRRLLRLCGLGRGIVL